MSAEISFALLCFTSFFTIINPFGTMPVFLTMTANLDSVSRRKTAWRASVVAFFTMLLFAFSGQMVFQFFHISIDSFRIVGGILFFIMGFDMLNARLTSIKIGKEEIKEYVNDISITPLGIPMLCGPGAITNAIVLMEDANTFSFKVILLASMLAICLLTFLVLWSSTKILKVIGQTGNNVMMRLMGLIVMVIAVELFMTGLQPFVEKLLHS